MRPALFFGHFLGRASFRRVSTIALCFGTLVFIRPSFADEIGTIPAAPAPNVVAPGLNLNSPEPAPSPNKPLVHRWWFWTAIGAATATVIVLVATSNRGNTPPSSLLGNQEFQP